MRKNVERLKNEAAAALHADSLRDIIASAALGWLNNTDNNNYNNRS